MTKVLTNWKGNNYFFAVKNTESWTICPYKFLLTHTDGTLCGQYISSIWFKMCILLDHTIKLAIVKIPASSKRVDYINAMNQTNNPENLDFILGYTELTKERLSNIYYNDQETISWSEELNKTLRLSFSYPRKKTKRELRIYCPSFSVPLK